MSSEIIQRVDVTDQPESVITDREGNVVSGAVNCNLPGSLYLALAYAASED